MVPKWRFQAQRLFDERRNLLGPLTEVLLKITMLGKKAHGVAEQARGGLAPGAQQRVQDGQGFEVAEHAALSAASDCTQEVLTRVLRRRRELIGEPGLDLADPADELHQLIEG